MHAAEPALQPHQADGLIASIVGSEIDLSAYGLADGKALVSAILDAVPTVEIQNPARRQRA